MADERWAQISRIYNDAAALAPVDRAAFLRNACGDDEVPSGPRSNPCCATTAVRMRYCNRKAGTQPLSGSGSAATRFARCSASAGWVKCIAPAIRT